MCNINILDRRRKVYYFLALNNTPEIFNWWIPKFGVQSFPCSVLLICLLENTCLFPETVFISTTALSFGLLQCRLDSCILNSMFDFSWYSLCTTDILLMLSYVTRYHLIKFLRAITLIIEYLLNHTSCLYTGTVALWVTARVPPFPALDALWVAECY